MFKTKKRRDIEIYEEYWKFTAAHTDITGTKFNNCLNVIIIFIEKNKQALREHAKKYTNFNKSPLYEEIQDKIVLVSGFKGKDATLSARKVINQYVKIGFIKPFLVDYHPLVKQFLLEQNKEKKLIIFSKIFYNNSSLASDVTINNENLKHVNFLLKTLDRNSYLTKKDIIALMVTNINNYSNGYLTRQQLDSQYTYAMVNEFDERKYNQISHLISYLSKFVDLKYDKINERFWFADDPLIADQNFDESYVRDGIKHRIYKKELKQESISKYGKAVCYLEKIPYTSLIASHIKPCKTCLIEHREDQAYDVENGLLLSPTVDSYFDKFLITFNNDGTLIFGNVSNEFIQKYHNFTLDQSILTPKRKEYLEYHRNVFFAKNKNKSNN